MNQNKFMLGVDIGTTSTKAVLYRETGEIIAQSNQGYDLNTPDVRTAEQNPEEIYQAVLYVIRQTIKDSEIDKEDLSFISFSSAMHSLIAMDENNKAITPCITWADNRSLNWANKIKDEWNGNDVYMRTGTPIHPMSPLSKITWLEQEHPELAGKTKKYIGIKEYVFNQLFGEYVMDYSLGSATG